MRPRRCRGWWECAAAGLCVSVSVSVSACAGQRDQELRLAEELGRARAEAAWQAARATELESRLVRLEQRISESPPSRTTDDGEIVKRLDRLIASNAHPALEPGPATAAPQATCVGETESPPEAQIRVLVERLRGRPGRFNGPLTRDQNETLRKLLKPERQLDVDNPWPEPWY